ncbi:MAG: GFA family protein [Terrimicrobiaceae bacterium]|nr:GFA family protein [Terrimicrobiaceae bacterium]
MKPPGSLPHTGGCLCGSVRYEIDEHPLGTSYCHCEDCRRASGAPATAWTFFRSGSLRFVASLPKTLQWAGRERTFCPNCGTPLTFLDPALPHIFEVTTGSLDHPGQFPPGDHNWINDRLAWFPTGDGLPEFPENSPPPQTPVE